MCSNPRWLCLAPVWNTVGLCLSGRHLHNRAIASPLECVIRVLLSVTPLPLRATFRSDAGPESSSPAENSLLCMMSIIGCSTGCAVLLPYHVVVCAQGRKPVTVNIAMIAPAFITGNNGKTALFIVSLPSYHFLIPMTYINGHYS